MVFNHNRYMKSWSETKKMLLTTMILVVIVISVIILSGYISSVFAIDDNVTVIVNISQVSQIEVLPTLLNWTGCTPGADCGNKTLDVKNIGSINLTDVWAQVNTTEVESTNPLGSGSASSYSAGGLMAMTNDTELTWYFVGRLEWNISYTPTFYSPPSGAAATNRSWGWFRNTSYNYLWELYNGTPTPDTNCSSANTVIKIELDADAGTSDTRNPSESGTFTAGTGEWGVATFSNGPWTDYCVATYYDCTKIYIYKYDFGSQFPDCGADRIYLTANLVPGDVVVYHVRAWVPEGIPAGDTTGDTLTISAT